MARLGIRAIKAPDQHVERLAAFRRALQSFLQLAPRDHLQLGVVVEGADGGVEEGIGRIGHGGGTAESEHGTRIRLNPSGCSPVPC